MTSILFVDDESHILSGLRRMLRSNRREWSMSFANSGQEALDWLTENECDIVVSDMRMPKMDGSQLLTQVKDRFPATVRMVLSGQSEIDSILRAAGCAHQFLSKPSTPELIKATITNAIELRSKVESEENRTLALSVASLPSEANSFAQLQQALSGPVKDFDQASATIAADPAMSAKVLQMVNSSFFVAPADCESAKDANGLLGIDNLGALLESGAFRQASGESDSTIAVHSRFTRKVGENAIAIGKQLGADLGTLKRAKTAANLHLISQLCDEGSSFDPTGSEQQVLTSALLLGIWGVPRITVDVVANSLSPNTETELGAATIVHLARHLASVQLGHPQTLAVDEAHIKQLGIEQQWEQLTTELLQPVD